jgi:hypothetical protein
MKFLRPELVFCATIATGLAVVVGAIYLYTALSLLGIKLKRLCYVSLLYDAHKERFTRQAENYCFELKLSQ